jgi:hypothetical protein
LNAQDVKNIWDNDFLSLKQRVGGSSPPRLTTSLRAAVAADADSIRN